MYERFYGLRERAFTILPNPQFLYFSRHHRIAYGLLEYGLMQQAGFVVITGGIGTGKTTLVRYLMGHIGQNVAVGLVANTHPGFGGLLEWVVEAFGLDVQGTRQVDLYRAFSRFLRDEAGQGRRSLLLVDEAQNLRAEGLEELRTLSNLNGAAQLLQIVLVGQPGLRKTLAAPDMEQLAQRVVVDYQLQPLTREETTTYVVHRLRVAGGHDPHLFDAAALEQIFLYSQGVPRLINLLCESALVYGYATGTPRVGGELVKETVRDRIAGGLLPLPAEARATL
jgi:type II secretory pathway predicted ATPase ExeA